MSRDKTAGTPGTGSGASGAGGSPVGAGDTGAGSDVGNAALTAASGPAGAAKQGYDKVMSAIDSSLGEGVTDSPSGGDDGSDLDVVAEEAPQGEDTGVGGTDVIGSKMTPQGQGPMGQMARRTALSGAAATAPVAAQIAAITIFLNWLKMIMAMIMAAAQSFISAIINAVVAVAKAVVGFFISVGSAIASAVGGAVSAGVATVSFLVVVMTAGATLVVAGTATLREGEIARSDGAIVACDVAVTQAVDAAKENVGDVSAQTETNAKTAYSVLSAWGMSDENIAGVLGNWSVESGIDPTSVETIFDEKYMIGDRKKAAQEAGFKISAVNPDYARRFPSIDLMGIGLGQWTNGRNTLLTDYAASINQPWYTLETQLGFMVSKDDPTRVNQVKSLIDGSAGGSVESATSYFLTQWEGISNGTLSERTSAAGSWYAKMGGWEKNQSLADSILAQAGTAVDAANTTAVSNAASRCKTSTAAVDNSSLVNAAISYTWAYNDEGKGNDGTDIYKYLHKQVLGEADRYFASCDRTMATGVRWSGTDDSYPAGGVAVQLEYVQNHPEKWQKVDYNGDKSNLQPGDILLRSDNAVSHTVMYVGNEAITNVWGEGNFEPGAEIVSGSLNDRSPTVGVFYTGCSTCLDTGYVAYRNVQKEASSQYTDITVPAGMQKGTGDKTTHITPGP